VPILGLSVVTMRLLGAALIVAGIFYIR